MWSCKKIVQNICLNFCAKVSFFVNCRLLKLIFVHCVLAQFEVQSVVLVLTSQVSFKPPIQWATIVKNSTKMNLLPMYQKCFELFRYVYCITNRLDCTISSQILLHCDTKLNTMCLLTQSNNRTCLIKTEYNFFCPSLSHIYTSSSN